MEVFPTPGPLAHNPAHNAESRGSQQQQPCVKAKRPNCIFWFHTFVAERRGSGTAAVNCAPREPVSRESPRAQKTREAAAVACTHSLAAGIIVLRHPTSDHKCGKPEGDGAARRLCRSPMSCRMPRTWPCQGSLCGDDRCRTRGNTRPRLLQCLPPSLP